MAAPLHFPSCQKLCVYRRDREACVDSMSPSLPDYKELTSCGRGQRLSESQRTVTFVFSTNSSSRVTQGLPQCRGEVTRQSGLCRMLSSIKYYHIYPKKYWVLQWALKLTWVSKTVKLRKLSSRRTCTSVHCFLVLVKHDMMTDVFGNLVQKNALGLGYRVIDG